MIEDNSNKEQIETINIKNHQYKILKNVNKCLKIEELEYLYTEYFESYDYILGDYSYDKLRLKGFCKENNKLFNNINDIKKVDDYIKNYCSYKSNYFLLEKI